MLTSQGYAVRRVPTGSLALKSIELEQPDLVLMDIRMPGMDGYEVCQRLKASPITCEIPVIFMSALTETLHKVRAFKAGGADFISKPFEFAEVLARIENHLTLRSLQRQLQCQNQTLQQEMQLRQQREASLQIKAQQEQALSRVILAIHNSLRLDTVFFTAIYEIRQLLRLSFADILRYDPQRSVWLSVSAPRADRAGSSTTPRIAPTLVDGGNPVTAQLKRLELVRVDEAGLLTDEIHRVLAQKGDGAWLLVPLRQGQPEETHGLVLPAADAAPSPPAAPPLVWGCLCLQRSTAAPWQDSEVDSATAFAAQLAIAIQQGQLYQSLTEANHRLNELATLDGLTQVANRRRFNEYLDAQWRESRREQSPLSLVLCDVDYFKKFNDTYGHLAGDDCLKSVARAIAQIVKRPDDLVARYGGEEFAMILPRTDLTGAAHIAQIMRLAVQRLQIPHCSSHVRDTVSLSLGVASLIPTPETDPQVLINQADQALYQAKAAGRDRLALHKLASIDSVA